MTRAATSQENPSKKSKRSKKTFFDDSYVVMQHSPWLAKNRAAMEAVHAGLKLWFKEPKLVEVGMKSLEHMLDSRDVILQKAVSR